jgi:hypothetical protein
MYVFSQEFVDNLSTMISGPGKFRFVVQPLIAVALGLRDGLRDVKEGRPPFLISLLFKREYRKQAWTTGKAALITPFLVAIVMDSIFQIMLLHRWKLGGALAVGVLLIGLPYSALRGFSNRISNIRKRRKSPKIEKAA